jgi:hypothetical protein
MIVSALLPKVVVRDDLRRSRLTTFFRFFLAIPHFVWLYLWGSGMLLVLPIHWVIALVRGRPNESLHEVYAMYLRYGLHVYAYATLAAEPFPGFLGTTTYPVDAVMPPPRTQSRWSIALRGILVLPPLFLAGALGSGMATSAGTSFGLSAGLAFLAGMFAWFAILARGRMPAGLRDVIVYALGYGVQTIAYLFLVTGAYPDSDPRAVQLARRPRHPVRIHDTDDRRRSRMTVGFRYVLATPHFFWSTLWATVILVVALPTWVCALVLGRLPRPLERFFTAFTRYIAHFNAFFYLAGNPFPGFVGKPGSYPVDLHIDEHHGKQSRWSIAFRWLLAIPAILLQAALSSVMTTASIGAWFVSLRTGRMPRGIQRLNSFGVRYSGQAIAYSLLLTPRYPHSGPSEVELPPGDPFLAEPERPAAARALEAA